jgi:hypothetical protein
MNECRSSPPRVAGVSKCKARPKRSAWRQLAHLDRSSSYSNLAQISSLNMKWTYHNIPTMLVNPVNSNVTAKWIVLSGCFLSPLAVSQARGRGRRRLTIELHQSFNSEDPIIKAKSASFQQMTPYSRGARRRDDSTHAYAYALPRRSHAFCIHITPAIELLKYLRRGALFSISLFFQSLC